MNDIRVGTIVAAEPFPEARRLAYRLTIDFGESLGLKRSSAQITELYPLETLPGTQVVAVMDLGTKRIANFTSEVLVLGVTDSEGRIVLLRPQYPIANGERVY